MSDTKNEELILTYFKKGEKLTVLDAWRICATTELRTYVSRIKKRGFKILSKKVKGERYNEYWLEVAA